MGLINDDHIEIIIRKLRQTFFPLHGLYGAYRDPEPAPQTGLLCFFCRTSQVRALLDLIRSLFQEFAPVRQDQYPVSLTHTVFCDFCKHDGLSAAGRQYQKGLQCTLIPLLKYGCFRFCLIRSQFHLEHTRLKLLWFILQITADTVIPALIAVLVHIFIDHDFHLAGRAWHFIPVRPQCFPFLLLSNA